MKSIITLVLLTISLGLQAHNHGNPKHNMDQMNDKQKIVIHNPSIKTTPPGITNSAGYFHLMNHSNKEIKLVDATSDISVLTEVHEHVMNNGVMKMQKVESITIPANSKVAFKPGGYHIMFINVHEPIAEGQEVKFMLVFSDGTKKTITATAKKQKGSMHKHHGKH